MAAADHSPSRRALLGAAVGLSFDTGLRQAQPLLRMSGEGGAEEAPPPAPSELGEEWEVALAGFEAAAGAVRAYEALCRGRPFAEQEALQSGYDSRCEAMEAALARLLLAPAPDLAALARKVELVLAHEIEPLSGGAPGLAAIQRDALRLAQSGTVG